MQSQEPSGDVRGLIKSVTVLSRHLGLTPNAIYRWIKLNRIPAKQILKVSKFYDIDIPLHLVESEVKSDVRVNEKPRETLPVCIQVQNGEIDLSTAAQKLGLHERAVQLILSNWGDELPTLYRVLDESDRGVMSIGDASETLNVSKFNVHALRRKYGFRPTPRLKPAPRPIVQRRKTTRALALAVIAGHTQLMDAEKMSGLSWRTIHRAIAKLSPDNTLTSLTHWPKALREAYAYELEHGVPQISVNLWEFMQKQGVPVKKWPKYPPKPRNWRNADARNMMIHLLLGTETMDLLAVSRRADPKVLESIFTGALKPLGLTWPQVFGLSVLQQIAVAEVLLALDYASKTPRRRMIERLERPEE
jgi:hypothetical protein